MDEKEFTEHRIEEEKRLASIESNLAELKSKLDTLQRDVSDLVTAWKAASFVLSVIKGLGVLAVAWGSIMLFLKGGK